MKNKQKTHSGTKKRFKLTANGKIKRGHATAAHLLSKKTPKRRRKLRSSALVAAGDLKSIKGALSN